MREVAERRLRDRGQVLCDVRSREIRGDAFDRTALVLRETRYASALGEECFLEFVTPEDRLVGFCRLALPRAPVSIDDFGRRKAWPVHVIPLLQFTPAAVKHFTSI